MINVIVVGSNPSQSSPDCSNFHIKTRSRIILERWFDGLGCQISYTNVSHHKTENNRPLTTKEIKNNLLRLEHELKNFDKIVALGDTASKALSYINLPHFKMWHPSGRCRHWNDKEKANKKINDLKEYVKEKGL